MIRLVSATAGLALLIAAGAGCDRGRPLSTIDAPPTPPAGRPQRGREIDDARLEHHLPPPPVDAVAYDVRDPLRNGRTTADKRRCIWIPDGTRIALVARPSGKLEVKLPVGAKLWKEFYLGTSRGVALVERRLLLKVADRDEANGWLLNGGWRFYTASYLPVEADGVTGLASRVQIQLGDASARRYTYRPQDWLPTRAKGAATTLVFVDAARRSYPYLLPGKSGCELCHGGAAALYANAEPAPVMAFGSHPVNLTPASLRALVKRGWIDAPASLLAEPTSAPASRPGLSTTAARGERVLAMLRNNCLSCHNSSPRAAAHGTAFQLDPVLHTSTGEALKRLATRTQGGRAIVAPGQPAQSEMAIRLRGAQGSRRMPPAEGGVPEPDLELGALVSAWITELAADGPRGGALRGSRTAHLAPRGHLK
jgi:hypothetical protein